MFSLSLWLPILEPMQYASELGHAARLSAVPPVIDVDVVNSPGDAQRDAPFADSVS